MAKKSVRDASHQLDQRRIGASSSPPNPDDCPKASALSVTERRKEEDNMLARHRWVRPQPPRLLFCEQRLAERHGGPRCRFRPPGQRHDAPRLHRAGAADAPRHRLPTRRRGGSNPRLKSSMLSAQSLDGTLWRRYRRSQRSTRGLARPFIADLHFLPYLAVAYNLLRPSPCHDCSSAIRVSTTTGRSRCKLG
jgi:hypothetical protein